MSALVICTTLSKYCFVHRTCNDEQRFFLLNIFILIAFTFYNLALLPASRDSRVIHRDRERESTDELSELIMMIATHVLDILQAVVLFMFLIICNIDKVYSTYNKNLFL